jgi:ribose transport system ATP-binding protein
MTVKALEAAAGAERARALSPAALVSSLAPADCQLVEIARALAHEHCRVIILDEPTSSLGRDEAQALFERVRALRDRGMLVLYISHFLEEIEQVADRFTVLRDGRTVGAGKVEGTLIREMVTMMAGRQVDQLFVHGAHTAGDVVLSVSALSGVRKPTDATLSLRRGEVLGIAGLVGSGRTELLRAIFGLDPVVRGHVRVGAYVGPGSPAARLAQGVGMLSEDRKAEGLALALSIADNVTLSKLTGLGPAGLVLRRPQAEATRPWIERLGIRCQGPEQPVQELSGGNQQKVALARLLHHDVDVLLLDEPTRGIDVASKADIYKLIDDVATKGKAVLMVSDHLPELLGACDQIAVMHRGRLEPPRPAGEWSEASLLAATTGSAA